MAVEAERAREAVALQFSKKAQYYDKMKLKDEEFAFKDEEGMPTVCAALSCHMCTAATDHTVPCSLPITWALLCPSPRPP
jgi:hypothetical protein